MLEAFASGDWDCVTVIMIDEALETGIRELRVLSALATVQLPMSAYKKRDLLLCNYIF
jgi:hypothetical protein